MQGAIVRAYDIYTGRECEGEFVRISPKGARIVCLINGIEKEFNRDGDGLYKTWDRLTLRESSVEAIKNPKYKEGFSLRAPNFGLMDINEMTLEEMAFALMQSGCALATWTEDDKTHLHRITVKKGHMVEQGHYIRCFKVVTATDDDEAVEKDYPTLLSLVLGVQWALNKLIANAKQEGN